jgi:nucleoid-associated protein YgaU
MQQIERYGVIALAFLLVTIVAISFWGDSKSPGFWKRLTGQGQAKPEQVAKLETPALPPQIADPNLQLSPGAPPAEPQTVPSLGQPNPPTAIDNPNVGAGTPQAPGFASDPAVNPTSNGPVAPPETRPIVTTPPAPTPAPAASRSEYVVQRGDSLARIARTQLGAESRWPEIAALNPRLDPKSLSVGQTILLPDGATKPAVRPATLNTQRDAEPKAAPRKAAAAVAKKSGPSSRSCTVQKGDTLRSIARRELGDEKRWKEIAGVNPGVDPARLAIGQRLKLPASAGGELIAAVPASKTNADGPRVR